MSEGYFGQAGTNDDVRLSALVGFLVQQHLAHTRTMALVKVVAVKGGGPGGAPPTVDVQPLVKQMDGVGGSKSHGTIYGLPTHRLQAGTAGFVADPEVGDVGLVHVADRDISSVKANGGGEANPGSFRRHDLADGVYHGMVLKTAALDRYIQFNTSGVKIVGKQGSTIEIRDDGGDPVIYLKPSGSHLVYLGGDGTIGSYDFVVTLSGPSINVKARYA